MPIVLDLAQMPIKLDWLTLATTARFAALLAADCLRKGSAFRNQVTPNSFRIDIDPEMLGALPNR